MFQWLKNLFRRKERYDVYTPSEKLIYAYYNGKDWVSADPIAVFRRLKDVWGDLSVDMKVARSPMKDATVGHRKALDKIRKIFNLTPLREDLYADNTLTDLQASDLLEHFLTYVGSLKKNSSQNQTSATETSDSTPSTSEDSQPTQSIADSGSTENGQATEQQQESVSESPSV